jgi:hypothetical protein
MSGVERKERETEEIAPCRGKATGHVPGTEAVTAELGETTVGPVEVWGTLREGHRLVLRCGACGVRLAVGLSVRVEP